MEADRTCVLPLFSGRAGHRAVVTAPAEFDLGTAEQPGIAVLAALTGHETIVIDLPHFTSQEDALGPEPLADTA
jgi:hypothetical protein